MGNAAGLKAWQVLANAERALAIELLAGAQAVEFLAPLEPGAGVAAAREFVRSLSPRLREDRSLAGDIEAVAAAIRDGSLVAAVEARGRGAAVSEAALGPAGAPAAEAPVPRQRARLRAGSAARRGRDRAR